MRYSFIIVTAMLSLLSHVAHADNVACYAPSPNLSAFGDAYYDLENTSELSDEAKNSINAFFNTLAGQWRGDARTIECRGPDRAPIVQSHDATISAQAHLNNMTSLSIDAKKHDIDKGIKQSETLALLGNTAIFNLEFVGDSHLIFSEKYRRLNKPVSKADPKATTSTLRNILNKITGNNKTDDTTSNNSTTDSTKKKAPETRRSSRITETIYDVILENNVLIVSRSYYTNGVFTGGDLWQLFRD